MWEFIILDEAHAIKNSKSQRWRTLLNLKCRNRLLLTGTPIRNTMADLWASLHFIMPTFFDSQNEFQDWFLKDIDSNDSNSSKLSDSQIKLLHMIIKPFMVGE